MERVRVRDRVRVRVGFRVRTFVRDLLYALEGLHLFRLFG